MLKTIVEYKRPKQICMKRLLTIGGKVIMARRKFERNRPLVSNGTIGHVEHRCTMLTAAINMVLADHDHSQAMKYNGIDKAPKKKVRGITSNLEHLKYEFDTPSHCTHGRPQLRQLHEEHNTQDFSYGKRTRSCWFLFPTILCLKIASISC